MIGKMYHLLFKKVLIVSFAGIFFLSLAGMCITAGDVQAGLVNGDGICRDLV